MEQIYCNYYKKETDGKQYCFIKELDDTSMSVLSTANSNATGYHVHCSYCKYNQTRIDKDNRHKEIDSLKKQAMLGFKIK